MGTLVLVLGGCSSPEKALRARAVDFYNFLRGTRPDDSYLTINAGRVKVQMAGNFGISWVEARQDEPLVQSSPVKWVLDGGTWYLFQGSEAEVKQFGEYPRELLQRQKRAGAAPKAPSQPIEEPAPEEPPPSPRG